MYDREYFAWQERLGKFGALVHRPTFSPYIRPGDRVVDFGCGGGFLLASLECRAKMGVEVNQAARERAGQLGVKTKACVSELPEEWADVVISNSALEHVEYPLGTLRELYPKVRNSGLLVF